jgi:hypothetical protein|tara:strand:- start:216 stop:533 length:318 start_codon:yes stop_codon:yes gene_type:complete
MNTEELKMVLDALGGLGDAATTGAIVYLAWLMVKLLVCWGGGIYLATLVIKAIASCVNGVACEIRDMLGVGVSGYLSNSEASSMKARISALLEMERNLNKQKEGE